MISKVNFMGRVFYAGNTKLLSESYDKERKALSKYARQNNCDIMVLDRDYYVNGAGKYKTIVSKTGKYTGRNILSRTDFDFAKHTTKTSDFSI